MRRVILIACTCLLQTLAFGQGDKWKESAIIPSAANKVWLDQLNQVYTLKKGEIVKYDPSGKEVNRYSNKMIGERVLLDVSNPMKVLLFSPDQMRLTFLDSRLGEIKEELNLMRFGYEQISLAATSHSNGFWLYDPISFKIIRYDERLKKERESLNIAQLLRVEFYPTSMVELNNKVYLSDPNHGIYIFDIFGNYLKRIPIKEISLLQVSAEYLFFQKADRIYAFNLSDHSEVQVASGIPKNALFTINRNRLCILSDKAIFIYKPTQ